MRLSLLQRRAFRLSALMAFIALPSLFAKGEESVTLPGSLDFLAVKDVKVATTTVFEDENVIQWTGEGFHAGVQSCTFTLYNIKEIPSQFEVPENPTVYCIIKDAYGNEVYSSEKNIANEFNKMKLMKNYSSTSSISVAVPRGGEYQLTLSISPDLFSYEQDMVVKDEAGARVTNTKTKVNLDLCPIVTITSGYPYDPETVKGEKTLHWTVSPANDPTKIIADQTETFELDADKPKLAAVAELPLAVDDELEPGEYIFTLTSDFAPACRTFKAYVYDVPDVEVSLNKTEYKVGEDTEATLKVTMSYGYPYISIDTNTEKNSVFMTTKLLEESKTTEYSDLAWADREVHCTADLTVSIAAVTDEVVNQYKGKVPLTLRISFNGESQYESTVIIPFAYDSAGIEGITVDNSVNAKIKYFNIFGVEVDDSYRGIVISSDGHKTIRK